LAVSDPVSEGIRVGISPVVTPTIAVSGLRAALFAWLHARAHGGTLVLCVADAQGPRIRDELTSLLLEHLRWIGIDWQEGPDVGGPYAPYLTSRRAERYRDAARRLLEAGIAFRCFCTPEEIEDRAQTEKRRRAAKQPKSHRCSTLSASEAERRARAGARTFLRLRGDACGRVACEDAIRGRIFVEPRAEAFLVDPDGAPFDGFASALDDVEMKIDVAFRDDESLHETAVRIRVARELGLTMPRIAHVPEVLGTDGERFGKRHGAATAQSFRRLGYHPRAVANYLVGLSWRSPSGERFDPSALYGEFSRAPIRPEPATFDFKTLNRLSNETIREESPDFLLDRVYPYLLEGGFVDESGDRARLRQVVAVCRDHLSCLSEIVKFADIFFGETYIEPKDRKLLKREASRDILMAFRERLQHVSRLDSEALRRALADVQRQTRATRDTVHLTVRVALTGQTEGPDVAEVAPVLGARACAEKVDRALQLAHQS
jgi:glutamyl-tRNA synthetase